MTGQDDVAATRRSSGAQVEGMRILRQLVDELSRDVGAMTAYEVRNDRETGKRTYTFVCYPKRRRP